jgi:branched-chain amino acid transport system substrate-binding protein
MRWVILYLALVFTVNTAHADIVVGVAGPMTGAYAAFGAQMLHGAQLAVDDINAKGGIAGEILLLQSEDDGCDNRQAETVAKSLVDKLANVVIGHFCSNPALAAARIYEAAGIPMIAPSASLPALTDAGLWNVIRIASRDDAQGEVAALRIAQDFPTGVVAVLSDGMAPNAALARRFTSNLGKAPALALTFKPNAVDFDGLLNEIKTKRVDVIYFACSASDAGRIADGLQQLGVKAALFGADPLLDDQYWMKSGDAGEGTFVSFAADPQLAADAKPVIKALQASGFDSNGATLPAYAAVQLFATASEASSAKNGKAIANYLRSGKSISTAVGALAFDAKGDVQPPRFVWYKWSVGAYSAESPAN